MQEFGFFLGRFHVLALHLPIGIIIAALAACGALALVLRRHLGVQRPLGA